MKAMWMVKTHFPERRSPQEKVFRTKKVLINVCLSIISKKNATHVACHCIMSKWNKILGLYIGCSALSKPF